MPRLFIGIKITTTEILESTYLDLKQKLSSSKIKWVDPKNFHLTLKFLGEVEEYFINSLIILLDKISDEYSQFNLISNGFGFFGRPVHPRIIWYGFQPEVNLISMQSSIEKSLVELGFDKEEKDYSPHLTLGRVKKMMPNHNLKEIISCLEIETEKYTVTKFSLIQSILKPEGPKYKVLKDFRLRES
jgi:2'-5' RNA ligase